MDNNATPSPTSRRLLRTLRRGSIGFLRLVREVLRHLGPALAALWRVARPVLRAILQMLLALIIVFEEWGWQPLQDLLGRLAKWRPWAAVETAIARLPPYAALVVFVLPSTVLLPLKFLAVFLVAKGQILLAGLLFLAAKLVATALIARLFLLTQPALMQIGWFARVYDSSCLGRTPSSTWCTTRWCGGWRGCGRSASVAPFAVSGGRCAPPCGCGAGVC